MNVSQWFAHNFVNRFRQFGFFPGCAQILKAAIRPVYQVKRDIILAITDHHPETHDAYPDIFELTEKAVMDANMRGCLNLQQKQLMLRFLNDGCRGFYSMVEDRFAGYAFVQPAGVYNFAGSGCFHIPKNMMVLKNLLVYPDFRGHSLGKKLNAARLAWIPENMVPIGFVIPENRFAIRNLKRYGFKEMLTVTRTTWFKKWTRQHISVIHACDVSSRLIDGLDAASHNT